MNQVDERAKSLNQEVIPSIYQPVAALPHSSTVETDKAVSDNRGDHTYTELLSHWLKMNQCEELEGKHSYGIQQPTAAASVQRNSCGPTT